MPEEATAVFKDAMPLAQILPSKVDPLVSLMKVEKVPDSTYDMVGGLDKQIKEIKEVVELPIKHPELFESLGVAQPKVRCGPSSYKHSSVKESSYYLQTAWLERAQLHLNSVLTALRRLKRLHLVTCCAGRPRIVL